jgi:predicted nucleic acid-binding OB-fold protein
MPARAKHYMAERVRELIENWARWPGWASGGSSRSTLAWLDDFVANKRVGDYGPSVHAMGGEAADTHRALGRTPLHLSEVLIAHYTWRGQVDEKIERLNRRREDKDRISRRTYFRRLEDAHPVFMEQHRIVRENAHEAERRNVEVASAASAAVARRHRLLVKPSLGLKKPEPSENGP